MSEELMIGIPLDQPIPTNDPSPAEERLARGIARETARIQKANARFAAMSPAQQRVTLAKDVLQWIATGVMRAGSSYIMGDQLSLYESTQRSTGRETCLNGYTCEVCGIGALVVAATVHGANGGKLYRNGHLLGLESVAELRDILSPMFEARTVALVELAFEGPRRFPRESGEPFGESFRAAWDTRQWLRNSEEPDITAAIAFFDAHSLGGDAMFGRDERLKLIMENIVANGGEFKP